MMPDASRTESWCFEGPLHSDAAGVTARKHVRDECLSGNCATRAPTQFISQQDSVCELSQVGESGTQRFDPFIDEDE